MTLLVWWPVSVAHLSIASSIGRTRPMGVRSGGAISLRAVRRPGGRGAFGSEGFAAAEHVPDRLGQPPREVDLGDLGAALLADPRLGLLVAVAVDGRGAGMRGCLDERPAQVARSLL